MAALDKINPKAHLLFGYPTMALLNAAPVPLAPSHRTAASLEEAFMTIMWNTAANRDALLDSEDLAPAPTLSVREQQGLAHLAVMEQLPRKFVRRYYVELCKTIGIHFREQVAMTMSKFCAEICEALGLADVTQSVIHARIISRQQASDEHDWWWRLCMLRLAVLLQCKDLPEKDMFAWYGLVDCSSLALVDAIKEHLSGTLLGDFKFDCEGPDPANIEECLHGSVLLPAKYSLPPVVFLAELLLNIPTYHATSPLFVLLKKGTFHPSMFRMFGSVLFKHGLQFPDIWPCTASIVIASLLGSMSGEGPYLTTIADRALLNAMWTIMDDDHGLKSAVWQRFAGIVEHCKLVVAMSIRAFLLSLLEDDQCLREHMQKAGMQVAELRSVVFSATTAIRDEWMLELSTDFLNRGTSDASLAVKFQALNKDLTAQYRQPFLRLCMRRAPPPLLAKLLGAHRVVTENMPKTCQNCACHRECKIYCELEPDKRTDDARALDLLIRIFERVEPTIDAPEVLCVGALLVAGFPKRDVEEFALLVLWYYSRYRDSQGSRANGFLHCLHMLHSDCPRLYSFVFMFARLWTRHQFCYVAKAPILGSVNNSPSEPRKMFICPGCQMMPRESLFDGIENVCVVFPSFDGNPVYCCRLHRSASTSTCKCGCLLLREASMCRQELIGVNVYRDEVVVLPTHVLLGCSSPGCGRLMMLNTDLCMFNPDADSRGFMCAVCTIDWLHKHNERAEQSPWARIFRVFQKSRGGRTGKSAQASDVAMGICDVCRLRCKPGAEPKKVRINIVTLPRSDFDLLLCGTHFKDDDFLLTLAMTALESRPTEECQKQGACTCANGKTTCTGLMNLKTAQLLYKQKKEIENSGKEISRIMHTNARVLRALGHGGDEGSASRRGRRRNPQRSS